MPQACRPPCQGCNWASHLIGGQTTKVSSWRICQAVIWWVKKELRLKLNTPSYIPIWCSLLPISTPITRSSCRRTKTTSRKHMKVRCRKCVKNLNSSKFSKIKPISVSWTMVESRVFELGYHGSKINRSNLTLNWTNRSLNIKVRSMNRQARKRTTHCSRTASRSLWSRIRHLQALWRSKKLRMKNSRLSLRKIMCHSRLIPPRIDPSYPNQASSTPMKCSVKT